jgi:hypothetical protein
MLQYDTRELMEGATNLVSCIDRGVWLNCDSLFPSNAQGVRHYGVLQYIPGLMLLRLGFPRDTIIYLFVLLNFSFFVSLFWYSRTILTQSSKVISQIAWFALISSPMFGTRVRLLLRWQAHF